MDIPRPLTNTSSRSNGLHKTEEYNQDKRVDINRSKDNRSKSPNPKHGPDSPIEAAIQHTSHATTTSTVEEAKTILHRSDWPMIHALPDDGFRTLLREVINKDRANKITLEDCHITRRIDGGYHHVVFLSVAARGHVGRVRPVSNDTERKRCNFLQSLANQMSKLEVLSFDSIGMPDFTDVKSAVGEPPYELEPSDLEGEGQVCAIAPFASSKSYVTYKLDENWKVTPDPELEDDPETQNYLFGFRKFLDIVFAHPVIASSKVNPMDPHENETFVIHHPDLDLQNILVDDDGNMTAILDWDGCLAVPRCVGYASLPDFLRRPWMADYSLASLPFMMPLQVDKYADIYADAMVATGCSDAKYTRKSAMYRVIVDSITKGKPSDVVDKLCACIPGLRHLDIAGLQEYIGAGWPEAEEYVKAEFGKLLDPMLPFP